MNDLTWRFPLIVDAIDGLSRGWPIGSLLVQKLVYLARLRPRSCIIDGEAVACGADGIACFELIRRWDADENVFMWAFEARRGHGEPSQSALMEGDREATASCEICCLTCPAPPRESQGRPGRQPAHRARPRTDRLARPYVLQRIHF